MSLQGNPLTLDTVLDPRCSLIASRCSLRQALVNAPALHTTSTSTRYTNLHAISLRYQWAIDTIWRLWLQSNADYEELRPESRTSLATPFQDLGLGLRRYNCWRDPVPKPKGISPATRLLKGRCRCNQYGVVNKHEQFALVSPHGSNEHAHAMRRSGPCSIAKSGMYA
jgi:hypothetical protein